MSLLNGCLAKQEELKSLQAEAERLASSAELKG